MRAAQCLLREDSEIQDSVSTWDVWDGFKDETLAEVMSVAGETQEGCRPALGQADIFASCVMEAVDFCQRTKSPSDKLKYCWSIL